MTHLQKIKNLLNEIATKEGILESKQRSVKETKEYLATLGITNKEQLLEKQKELEEKLQSDLTKLETYRDKLDKLLDVWLYYKPIKKEAWN